MPILPSVLDAFSASIKALSYEEASRNGRSPVEAEASFRSMTSSLEGWWSFYERAELRIGKPGVLKVRGSYESDFFTKRGNLYVAPNIVVAVPGEKDSLRVTRNDALLLKDGPHGRVPMFGYGKYPKGSFYFYDALWDSCGRFITEAFGQKFTTMDTAVRAEIARTAAMADSLVREVMGKAARHSKERKRFHQKLSEFMGENPSLVDMDASFLKFCMNVELKELKNLITFVRMNKADSDFLLPEDYQEGLDLAKIAEVMDS